MMKNKKSSGEQKTLGPQLFWPRQDKPPSKELIEPVIGYWQKPLGGLWTSTMTEEGLSDWVSWCRIQEFDYAPARLAYVLIPRKDAKILTINCGEDLAAIKDKYAGKPEVLSYYTSINWKAIGDDYDGVHLTCSGNQKLHLSMPMDLNSWDVESTVWYRWVFEDNVKAINIKHIEDAQRYN